MNEHFLRRMEGLHSPVEAQGQPAALNPGAQHCHRRDVDLCYLTVIMGLLGGQKPEAPFLSQIVHTPWRML